MNKIDLWDFSQLSKDSKLKACVLTADNIIDMSDMFVPFKEPTGYPDSFTSIEQEQTHD